MKNQPTTNPSKYMSGILKKIGLMLFILLILGGLIFCIYKLNSIIKQPTVNGNKNDASETTRFDQITINRLNKLKISSENTSSQVLPTGRINPFSE